MKLLKTVLTSAAGIAAFAFALSVAAAPVSCGNAGLGNRLFTVDPALVGGFCYAQNGNFLGDDFSVTGLADTELLDKDTAFPDNADALIVSALSNNNTAGDWSFAASLWNTWDRLFLAAHYGGGGNTVDDNPDSFFIELEPFDASGTFALTGLNIQLNGLSNLYLVGIRCDQLGCNGLLVPEPETLLLLATGLIGLGLSRRRRGS